MLIKFAQFSFSKMVIDQVVIPLIYAFTMFIQLFFSVQKVSASFMLVSLYKHSLPTWTSR